MASARSSANGAVPLTSAQRRLLLEHAAYGGLAAFNVAAAFWFREPIDLHSVVAAWQVLTERHDSLRLAFDLSPVPRAVRRASIRSVVEVDEVSSRDEAVRALAEFAARPFELSTAPLARMLILTHRRETMVALVVHHAVCDGWSLGVLLAELESVYRGEALPSAGPGLPEAVALEAEAERRGAERGGVEYWAERLRDLPDLDLSASLRRLNIAERSAVGTADRLVPLHEVHELARRERTSPFAAAAAATAVLISRVGSNDDIGIGVPVANRAGTALERVVGYFANTVVLRIGVGDDPPFSTVVRRARDAVLEALEFQSVPFDRVVEAINPERQSGRNPLFQLMLSSTDDRVLELGRARGEGLQIDRENALFEVDVTLRIRADACEFHTVASPDKHDGLWSSRFTRCLTTTLRSGVAGPSTRVRDLDVLHRIDRQAARECSVPAGASSSRDVPVHEAVSAAARRWPAAAAVVGREVVLTYAELDRRADAVARGLVAAGIVRGDVVAVRLARSDLSVIGLLGVLKSGAAAMPLDPADPRQEELLSEADAAIVLVEDDGGPAIGACSIDIHHVLASTRSDNRPLPVVSSYDLAYVMHTSGSTGRAKAVAVPHNAIMSTVDGWLKEYRLTVGMSHVHVASPSFDNSLAEILRALLTGGTLHIATAEDLSSPSAILSFLERARPHFLDITPGLLRLASSSPGFSVVCSRLEVDTLVLGADRWDSLDGATVARHLPDTRLYNAYGVTEASVDTLVHHVRQPCVDPVPIGRPLSRAAAYVVDATGNDLPIDAIGELAIGGDGVAWGYLNSPRLTAERFVPDPFTPEPGRRMYRTGDRCRQRSDGLVELLGRADSQVKIGGRRVELGEIEAALVRIDGVRGGVVTESLGPPPGRLIAHVVVEMSADPSTTRIRRELSRRIPAYMVPSNVVIVDSLPLDKNGKVDRRSLAERVIPLADGRAADDHSAAADELQREASAAWVTVLGCRPEPEDSFFDVGGSSLLALSLATELRRRLGRDITAVTVFDHQTFAALCEGCRGMRRLSADERAELASSR